MSVPALRNPEPAYVDVEPIDEGNASPGAARFLKKLWLATKRFWWVPILTLILGSAAGAVFFWKAPPIYVSEAKMHEPVRVRLPEGGLFTEDLQNFVGTQSALLQAGPIRDLAIERMRNSGQEIRRGPDGQPEEIEVKLTTIPRSAVFIIRATGKDARYTQAYLNALMESYLEFKRTMRKLASSETLTSITEQLQRAERDLNQAQDAFAVFQKTNNMAILQEEGTIAGGYLARLRTQLADLELEEQILRAGYPDLVAAALQTEAPSGVSAEIREATADASGAVSQMVGAGSSTNVFSFYGAMPEDLQVAMRERDLLLAQQERLGRNLRPKHPRMVKISEDLKRLDGIIQVHRRQNQQYVGSSLQALLLKTQSVRESITNWESKVVEANTRISEADQLRLTVQRRQAAFERLNLLVQNVGISRNIEQDTMAVLEPAEPSERSYRMALIIAAAAAVSGLLFGLAILALVAFRDDRFDSHAELNDNLGGGIVGHLPEVKKLPKGQRMPLLEANDNRYMFAEAYRSLRSALLFLRTEGHRPKAILVTSALPGEGKSTVATNLARALAFGGARVILVDADLRKGALHEAFKVAKDPGLAEVLLEPELLGEAVRKADVPGLFLLPRGRAKGNPGDLLLGGAFDRVLELLRGQYDHVVFDSSPLFAADDSATIAPKLDGTVFVVRRGYSRAGIVREALDTLYQRQARILGVVFNRADTTSGSYHYYKYAEYYHSEEKEAVKA